ncbi:MAG: hypothetical protein COR54_17795 [Elusimicrobia bacterium CG22_combo_CG10-13_8_21_14_all_63_91]|nr:MAG: hypothetical protein COR54_17795 [Elusimicrobia bacterium CG22_combo_CG10-13_8_21_14_all_63_91]
MTAALLRLAPDEIPRHKSPASAISRRPPTAYFPSPPPRPTRTVAVPASHRSRSFPAASPLPVWSGKVEHRSSSEELLERALRELAREVYELKRKREQQSDERTETVTVELPEPLEDLPAVRRPEDPLAHLPPVRRRRDIESAGTAFTPFQFTPFRSEWADVVFRSFTTPGLI